MGTNLLLLRPLARAEARWAAHCHHDARRRRRHRGVAERAGRYRSSGARDSAWGNVDYQTSTTSTSAEFPIARNWPIARGISSRAQSARYAPVVVRARRSSQLFPDGAVPLASIRADNVLFQVIG